MPTKSSFSWPAMLAGTLSESSRIISDHSRHFLSLSILFLLPLSSLLISSPSLLPLLSHHLHSLPPQSLLQSPNPSPQSPIPALALAALLLPLLLAAVSAVTRSANNGFYGRPVRLLPALLSLPSPSLRLLSTSLSLLLVLSAVLALVLSLSLLLLLLLSALHVPSGSVPPYNFAALISALIIARLGLEWCLAGVVSVVESSWGFVPLRRSGELIDGMRLAAVCIWVGFGAGVGVVFWGFGMWGVGAVVIPVVVGKTVLGSALIAVMLLYVLVTHAVLYLYCKAVHGELIGEIVEEFASEYVTLPFDDSRVPHVVSVILR